MAQKKKLKIKNATYLARRQISQARPKVNSDVTSEDMFKIKHDFNTIVKKARRVSIIPSWEIMREIAITLGAPEASCGKNAIEDTFKRNKKPTRALYSMMASAVKDWPDNEQSFKVWPPGKYSTTSKVIEEAAAKGKEAVAAVNRPLQATMDNFVEKDTTVKPSYSTDLIRTLTYECLKRVGDNEMEIERMVLVVKDVVLNCIKNNKRMEALIRLPDHEIDFEHLATRVKERAIQLQE